METSPFQSLKLQIVEFLSLSKDAIHIHIGMSVFIFTVLLVGKGKITVKCLLPVFVVAFGLEAIDLFDDFTSVGDFRWFNSLHDFINTSLWPVIIVLLVQQINRGRYTVN
jgi:hypothetical protein